MLVANLSSFVRSERGGDLNWKLQAARQSTAMQRWIRKVARRRRLVTRDDNDGDAKDACRRGLIKEGQVGGTIRSS